MSRPESNNALTESTTKTMHQRAFSIIIVSYNTRQLLCECLDTVHAQLAGGDEVIVVDNLSADGSADRVAADYPWVRLVRNTENAGFAAANNHGLAISDRPWVWFLNPDTQLLPDARDAAASYLEGDDRIGLAGTALVNPDGSDQPSVESRYPGQRHTRDCLVNLPGTIAWVSGASMIARRDAVHQVNGFDERFPLYGEELDLCLMLRKAGWRIGFASSSRVMHIGGQSERHTTPTSVMIKKFNAELIFYKKHYHSDAVDRIKRKNRMQAAWRLLSLAPQERWGPSNPERTSKYEFYKLMWEKFR